MYYVNQARKTIYIPAVKNTGSPGVVTIIPGN